MVIGVSKSGSRRSSSVRTDSARCLVSTRASLQNSMPVQAIVPRRNADGRTEKPNSSISATTVSIAADGTSSTTTPCCAVSRTRPFACRSDSSASSRSAVPLVRPDFVVPPIANRPSSCSSTPMWSRWVGESSGAGPSGSARPRYSFSSTSRNFSGPQSAIRNFSRACIRDRR